MMILRLCCFRHSGGSTGGIAGCRNQAVLLHWSRACDARFQGSPKSDRLCKADGTHQCPESEVRLIVPRPPERTSDSNRHWKIMIPVWFRFRSSLEVLAGK